MKDFWIDIIKDFVCVRSFITLGGFGLAYYLMAMGKEIPDILMSIIDLLLGYWFGSKVAQAKIKAIIEGGNGNGHV